MSKYTPSYEGIGELLRAPFIVADMRRRGEKVLSRAEATAPDQPPYGEGYIASFEIESGVRERKTRRAFCTVRNTSRHGMFVEFGGQSTPKYRILGRALDAAKE